MPQNAHIDGLTVKEMLRIIGDSRLSGIATVVDRYRAGRMVFVWGRLVHARTEGQEKLGQTLVRKSLLSEQDLVTLLEVQQQGREQRPLGSLLTALGICDIATIEDELVAQIRAAFFELLQWSDATVQFRVDESCGFTNSFDIGLDAGELMRENLTRSLGAEFSGRTPAAPK